MILSCLAAWDRDALQRFLDRFDRTKATTSTTKTSLGKPRTKSLVYTRSNRRCTYISLLQSLNRPLSVIQITEGSDTYSLTLVPSRPPPYLPPNRPASKCAPYTDRSNSRAGSLSRVSSMPEKQPRQQKHLLSIHPPSRLRRIAATETPKS